MFRKTKVKINRACSISDSKSVPVSPNTSQGRRDFKFCRSANASPIGSNSNIAMVQKYGKFESFTDSTSRYILFIFNILHVTHVADRVRIDVSKNEQ